MDDHDAAAKKPSRTRTGCLNCRRKKRKCDERRPSCGACCKRSQRCEWGLKLSFRAENAHHLDSDHPSMRTAAMRRPTEYEILDVTSEVIRDYVVSSPPGHDLQDGPGETGHADVGRTRSAAGQSLGAMELTFAGVDSTLVATTDASPMARRQTENAVANLLYLSQGGQPRQMPASALRDSGRIPIEPTDQLQGFTRTVDTTVLLSKEDECILWRNWFDQVAPWLDMLDNERPFQLILPTMASDHDHLRFSMLALSARQMELKRTAPATACSSSLYMEAIHLLEPNLPSPGIAVIASKVIHCALEMLGSSPEIRKPRLESCASLIKDIGFTGFVGGWEQALFWCFARVDVCDGLASSLAIPTPMSRRAKSFGINLDDDVRLFRRIKDLTSWANYAVYLTAQVLDLLAPLLDTSLSASNRADPEFRSRWLRLWKYILDWSDSRPASLCPIMVIPSSGSSPFPTIIFSNPAAISGNQLYHTASLLMLQNQPHGVRLLPSPRSIPWHARRVCAISMSSDHHGAWANGIQPLWIAGRCLSHPAERRAILELLARIEKESAWETRWQAHDLEKSWVKLGE